MTALTPMDENSRKMADGWHDKARIQLETARNHAKAAYRSSEAVEAAQECVELSVKSVLVYLDVTFSLEHGWNKESLSQIAGQIRKRDLVNRLRSHDLTTAARLPRLLFLANFWAQFYLLAKYEMEQGKLAPPQELIQAKEAELAIGHADECVRAAGELRYLDEAKRKAVSGIG